MPSNCLDALGHRWIQTCKYLPKPHKKPRFRGVTRRSQTVRNNELVPLAGLEPALLAEPDFESGVSTNSTIEAREPQIHRRRRAGQWRNGDGSRPVSSENHFMRYFRVEWLAVPIPENAVDTKAGCGKALLNFHAGEKQEFAAGCQRLANKIVALLECQPVACAVQRMARAFDDSAMTYEFVGRVPHGEPINGRIAAFEHEASGWGEMGANSSEGGGNVAVFEQHLKGVAGHDDQVEAFVRTKILRGGGHPIDISAKRLLPRDLKHCVRGISTRDVMTQRGISVADKSRPAAEVQNALRRRTCQTKVEIAVFRPAAVGIVKGGKRRVFVMQVRH